MAKKKNTPKPDSDGADVLLQIVDNEYAVHRQKHAVELNYARKVCGGKWRRDLATKGFTHVTNHANVVNQKDYGGPSHSVATRKLAARRLNADFVRRLNACKKGKAWGCNDLPTEVVATLKKCGYVRRAK